MANAPAVSVIIPLYNAEKFLSTCLESLLLQTFTDFEVIIVDDCSTDNSVAIVESYLPKFNGRLILTRMEKNSGSGALPKKRGVMFSRGEYLTFLDNDDLYTPTAIEELYTLAKDFDADVVYCEQNYIVNADGNDLKITEGIGNDFQPVDEPTFETNDIAQRVKKILQLIYRAPQWRKFVKRQLLFEHEIFFPHTCHADDVVWTWGLLFYAKKFLRVPNITYVYRRNENSIMRQKRTLQGNVDFCLNPLIFGLKSLDELMSRHEFFQQNPQYRYALLENFTCIEMTMLFSGKFPSPAICDALRQKFGELFGEWDVLISVLFSAMNSQQMSHEANVKKLTADAAQDKAYIAELENYVAQSQRRIAELEAELNRRH